MTASPHRYNLLWRLQCSELLHSQPRNNYCRGLESGSCRFRQTQDRGPSTLSGLEDFPPLFGEAKSRENLADYAEYLREQVDPEVRGYWEKHQPNGRRRLSHFSRNIYRKVLLGHFIGTGHMLARLGGAKLRNITLCESLAEQRVFFDREIAPCLKGALPAF